VTTLCPPVTLILGTSLGMGSRTARLSTCYRAVVACARVIKAGGVMTPQARSSRSPAFSASIARNRTGLVLAFIIAASLGA
jgi:hypothetical protein